jgi:hypothetical protein
MSSIVSFDIYGTYINKRPSDKQLIRPSHIGVVGCALLISTIATVFHKGNVDFNWTLYMLGIVVCPSTFPTCFTFLWKGQTKRAAIISPIFGMLCGFAVWFGSAYAYTGEITISPTGKSLRCMFGYLTSCFVPLPTSLIILYIWPWEFDFNEFLKIKRVRPEGEEDTHKFNEEAYFSPERVAYMKRMSKIAAWWAIVSHPVPLPHLTFLLAPVANFDYRPHSPGKFCYGPCQCTARDSSLAKRCGSPLPRFELRPKLTPTVVYCMDCGSCQGILLVDRPTNRGPNSPYT